MPAYRRLRELDGAAQNNVYRAFCCLNDVSRSRFFRYTAGHTLRSMERLNNVATSSTSANLDRGAPYACGSCIVAGAGVINIQISSGVAYRVLGIMRLFAVRWRTRCAGMAEHMFMQASLVEYFAPCGYWRTRAVGVPAYAPRWVYHRAVAFHDGLCRLTQHLLFCCARFLPLCL
jgi:hypothetical protein